MLRDILPKLAKGLRLQQQEAHDAIAAVMAANAHPAELAAMLTAMAVRGEAPEELAGAAQAMRQAMTTIPLPDHLDPIDTCGTGGDALKTFNISTTAAIVASAAGACVAKHGNHTATRSSGSADLLAQLGIRLDPTVQTLQRCLTQIGIAFLYARALHPAMRHAADVRKALPFRTIFNLLGPLCNPAKARRQLIGCSSQPAATLVAEALAQLNEPVCHRAWVFCGHANCCELALSGQSLVYEVSNHSVRSFAIVPEALNLPPADWSALLASDPADSARIVRAVLTGQLTGPHRDVVCLNAGATLVVADLATDLPEAINTARKAIDSGAAAAKLDDWIKLQQ